MSPAYTSVFNRMANPGHDDFYLVLPSHARSERAYDNRPKHFKVDLPKELFLEGDWEVVVTELFYTHTFEGCPILSTRLHRTSSAFHPKTGSPSVKSTLIVGVPSDTNGFHRTCAVSVRKTLRKLSSSGQRGSKFVPMESIGHE